MYFAYFISLWLGDQKAYLPRTNTNTHGQVNAAFGWKSRGLNKLIVRRGGFRKAEARDAEKL